MNKSFRLTIEPSIDIEVRHAIQETLESNGYSVIGAGTDLQNETMDISFEKAPKEIGNVIPLGGITKLNIDVNSILNAAKNKLEGVVLVGFAKDGEVYAASSYADGGDVMWLLEACKTKMMEAIGDK